MCVAGEGDALSKRVGVCCQNARSPGHPQGALPLSGQGWEPFSGKSETNIYPVVDKQYTSFAQSVNLPRIYLHIITRITISRLTKVYQKL